MTARQLWHWSGCATTLLVCVCIGCGSDRGEMVGVRSRATSGGMVEICERDYKCVALVVLNAGDERFTKFGSGSGGGPRYHGLYQVDGRREIQWECTMSSGSETGRMVIEGKDYPLSDGNVFLIPVDEDADGPRQLALDLAPLDGDTTPAQLERYIDEHAEIARFLGREIPEDSPD